MKAKININSIDKARAKALRWAKHMKNCSFTGYQFYLAHITNALNRVGFECSFETNWNASWTKLSYAYQIMFWRGNANDYLTERVELQDGDLPSKHVAELTDIIVKACEGLADWLHENGKPSTD